MNDEEIKTELLGSLGRFYKSLKHAPTVFSLKLEQHIDFCQEVVDTWEVPFNLRTGEVTIEIQRTLPVPFGVPYKESDLILSVEKKVLKPDSQEFNQSVKNSVPVETIEYFSKKDSILTVGSAVQHEKQTQFVEEYQNLEQGEKTIVPDLGLEEEESDENVEV